MLKAFFYLPIAHLSSKMNMITMKHFLIKLFILSFVSSNASAQQNYSGISVMNCKNNDDEGPSPAFLYTCNGRHKSCLAFLIFNSQPPYNTVPAISNLTSSNPNELARINEATMLTEFPTGKEVIVPVNCSCITKDYYQAETKYMLNASYYTYFTVANGVYQGLSSCDSLRRANPYGEFDLNPGMELHVPLRCACPTRHQIANGTKYMLTYPVYQHDGISGIGNRFNVSAGILLDANGFSTQDPVLYPFTTILIPLPSEPTPSMTPIHVDPSTIPPPPVYNSNKGESKRKLYIAVATIGGFMLVFSVILCAIFLLRKKSARFFKGGTKENAKWVSREDIREEIASIEHVSKVYSFKEIKEATENFSSKKRIRGCVYRGVFGSTILAVKKMSGNALKEVNMLKKINHFNLIKLQGYCKNNGFFYLVFEYMENGSLREWLSKSTSTEHQSWNKRLQIAMDIASGLQYLHNFTEPSYVHKNINTSNILLNNELRAKIANFTLAKEADREIMASVSSTSHIVGTRGYMAPEYLAAGIITPKMDVYAFGVVLLELITSKDSITVQDGPEVMLSETLLSIMGKEDAEAKVSLFVDPSLSGISGRVLALELAKLSLACLIQEPARRPNMSEVVFTLLKIHTDTYKQISPSINDSPRLER